MANRWIDDPSFYATADIGARYTDSSNYTVVGGYLLGSGGSANLNLTLDSQATWIIGMTMKHSGLPSGDSTFLTFLDTGTLHVDFRLTPAGTIRATRNGTSLGVGTAVLAANTDYYVEFKVTISDTVGVIVTKVDNVTDLNLSSQDTRNAANASANTIQWARSTGTGYSVRRIYINDGSGGVDDDFWGPIGVATMTPSGAGNLAEWTPSASTNVSNVDDTTPDGDTTYNSTAANPKTDTFVMTNTGFVSGTVKGASIVNYLRKTDGAAATVAPVWRISGTDYAGTGISPTASYRFWAQQYRVSPATSSAWTFSELDGAEAGYKRTA